MTTINKELQQQHLQDSAYLQDTGVSLLVDRAGLIHEDDGNSDVYGKATHRLTGLHNIHDTAALEAQAHHQLIDGTLLEAVTSASAADEANALIQMRNGDENMRHPQSMSTDAQFIFADDAAATNNPSSGKGKRRRSITDEPKGTGRLTNAEMRAKTLRFRFTGYEKPPTPPPPPPPPPPVPETVFVAGHHGTSALLDARSAGVYSAAALFRKTASTTARYTRPPMHKLYADLELSPENFIHLQAQAKSYMLDEEHPHRRACVGGRGKGDTDMSKLKLFHCVREFLEPELGSLYFGPDSEGASLRKWSWPADVNKVIAAVTPLLRRMVTNERQRQYANESRKGNRKKKADGDADPDASMITEATSGEDDVRPSLDSSGMLSTYAGNETTDQQQSGVSAYALLLHIVVVTSNGDLEQQQVIGRFHWPAHTYATFSALRDHVYAAVSTCAMPALRADVADVVSMDKSSESMTTTIGPLTSIISIAAFLPSTGLKRIEDDIDWLAAVDEAKGTAWMDQALRIVVGIER